MNGPTHYRKAEELLAQIGKSAGTERGAQLAAQAQAHATLAVAAATIDAAQASPARASGKAIIHAVPVRDHEPWMAALSSGPESDGVPEESEKKKGSQGHFM